MKSPPQRFRAMAGFSLVEVLLAFILVAVSTAGLIRLHNSYLRNEGSSSAREIAMHLAENKLDDLRSFTVLKTTTGAFAWQDIATNQGGQITAGNYTIGQTTFALSWSVTDTTPTGATLPTRKDVIVSVGWKDLSGGSQTLRLSSSLSATLSTGDVSGNTFGSSNTGPNITYTPGSVPDVVAVTIKSGTKIETSKPLPTVYQSGNNILVSTETITYDTATNRKVQEDQVTLSCSCEMQSGTANKSLPATPYLDTFGQYWRLGSLTYKNYGNNNSNQNVQSTLCSVCCENHFDGITGSAFTNYYNILHKDHKHYKTSGSGFSEIAAGGSGTYLEACRFLRIDGYYKPMPDWNLVSVNIMGPNFLADTRNAANYEKYVQAVVNAHYLWQKNGRSGTFNFDALDVWLSKAGNVTNGGDTTTGLSLSAGSTAQLIARGIYVDQMNSDSGQYLSKLDSTDSELLAKIPFHELNLTLLANWSIDTTNKSYATVTNETIKTIVDASQNYYGTYSRGRLTTLQATPANSGVNSTIPVTATIRTSNSGITSTGAISETDNTNRATSVNLKVTGSTTTAKVSIIGDIKCLTDPKNNSTTPQTCSTTEWNAMSVSYSGTSCTVQKPTGSSIAGYFTCSVTRGTPVVLSFGMTGFTFIPSSRTLTATDTAPVDTSGNALSSLSLNATNSCTTIAVKNSVSGSYSCQ